jgi:hypothetical protein
MHDSTRKPRREEFRGDNHVGSHSKTETEDVHMPTQKTKTWDTLQNHPIAKELEADAQLALLCEYVDLRDDLQGMSLDVFIDSYFAADAGDDPPAEAADEAGDEAGEEQDDEAAPSSNGDGEERPQSLLGLRVVYRFVGRNVLSDANGVTSDEIVDGFTGDFERTVAFTDVEGQPWSNVRRIHVYPINPKNYRVIHISAREAKEINGWLEAGKTVKGKPEGELLRSLFYEFHEFPEITERCAFAVMNGRRVYVDRFVQKPDGKFEDDQKPITWLLGEHCFRVRGKDYVVKVVSP